MAESDDEMEIINPPNTLRSKVRRGGPGAVDPAVLERAEKVIASMADSYLEWVQEDLKRLQGAYDQLVAAKDVAGRRQALEIVFQVAHDMKGQGGSFGYDLITAIGNELCRMIERIDEPGPAVVEAVKVHVDSIHLVIQDRITGDGGDQGRAMLVGIRQVCDRVAGGHAAEDASDDG